MQLGSFDFIETRHSDNKAHHYAAVDSDLPAFTNLYMRGFIVCMLHACACCIRHYTYVEDASCRRMYLYVSLHI